MDLPSKVILVLTSKPSRVPHTNMQVQIDLAHTRNECAPEASSLTLGMKLIYGMLSYSCRFIVYIVNYAIQIDPGGRQATVFYCYLPFFGYIRDNSS